MEGFSRVRDAADEGMVPMFDLVNSFLNALAPVTWAEMDPFINTEDSSMISELKQIAWYWWGFVLCLALGLLFMVLMPIVGCAVCCCRTCCGCCQEQNDVKKGKKSPPSCCKTVTCSLTLLILAGTMAAAISVAFFALPMMVNEIDPHTDTGVVKDLSNATDIIGTYLNDTAEDIEEAILPPLNATIALVIKELEEMPSTTFDDLAKGTGLDPALYDLQHYTNSLPELQTNLTAMDNHSQSLETQRDILDSELDVSRTNITAALIACDGTPSCKWLSENVDNLRSWAVYLNLSDTSAAAAVIQDSLNNGTDDAVNAAVKSFELIEQTIDNQTKSVVTELETKLADAENKVIDLVETGTEKLHEASNNLINTFDDIINSIETLDLGYVQYAYLGLVCVFSLAVMVAALYLFGLLFGMVCGSCGKKNGANCIMAGMAFTFIFSLLFWLLTVLFLAVGGTMYVAACRHLIALDESVDTVVEYAAGSSLNVSITESMHNCRDDQALYTAIDAEQYYNATEVVYDVLAKIEQEIKDYPFQGVNIDNVVIVTPEINATMFAIYEATNAIDFDSYYTELAKEVTFIPLPVYVSNMRQVANETNNDTLTNDLIREANELEYIYNTSVIPMEAERAQLLLSTTGAENFIVSNNISAIMQDLSTAETLLNEQGEAIVNASLQRQVNETYIHIETFLLGILHSLKTDVAKCYPLYEAYGTIVQAPCVYFLEPLNALWFFLGWFLAFGIFAICFASGVAGVFRSKAIMPKTSQVDTFGDYPMVNYKR